MRVRTFVAIAMACIAMLAISCEKEPWETGNHTITYISDGQTVKTEKASYATYWTPEKDGYTFIGWYLDGVKYTAWETVIDSDMTLVAGWGSVDSTAAISLEVDETATITATSTVENAEYTWSIDDGAIAEISSDSNSCTVKALSKGTATVTVSIDGTEIATEVTATYHSMEISEAGGLATLLESYTGTTLSISSTVELNSNDLEALKDNTTIKSLDLSNITNTEFPQYALYGNTTVETIVLPENLTTLGKYAISGCENLKEVVFPESLSTLERYTFEKSWHLEKLDLSKTQITKIPENFLDSGAKAIGEWDSELLYNDNVELILPDTVTEIDEYSFVRIKHLAINWPKGLKTICTAAFFTTGIECENGVLDLSGTSLEFIDRSAFYPTYKDDDASSPDPEVTITSVVLPKTLTKLSPMAFDYDYLRTITFTGDNIPTPESSAYSQSNNSTAKNVTTIYVPADLVDDFKASEWCTTYFTKASVLPISE